MRIAAVTPRDMGGTVGLDAEQIWRYANLRLGEDYCMEQLKMWQEILPF